jgi:cytoskeletal protein CcmA (bactofilin family)
MVSGHVQGTVRTTTLFALHKSGTLSGEVRSPRIQIEEGSIFQGKIDMAK